MVTLFLKSDKQVPRPRILLRAILNGGVAGFPAPKYDRPNVNPSQSPRCGGSQPSQRATYTGTCIRSVSRGFVDMRFQLTAPGSPQGQRFAFVALVAAMRYLNERELESGQILWSCALLVKWGKVELETFSWDEPC